MKKYAAIKGHGIRIGGANSNWTAFTENWCLNASSCRVECSWKVNIWNKKSKGHLEVTTLHDQYIGHEFHSLAVRFVLLLRKLPEKAQSTSRNEGKNSTLKQLFRSANLHYVNYLTQWRKDTKKKVTIAIQQLKEFVMPNIMKKQKEQMNLSLYYHATEVEPEVVFFKEKVFDESD
ncbi:421_t:CDS:2 [Funneliformis mosseae]|uniref:421_t:CDS:1 n=1 Tax=Funneliformis mosseae TaxID=27381 RepID=A0A9N9ELF1_FUNMO|nr:421_t:CDS:2 [Funneliformis mosseae]